MTFPKVHRVSTEGFRDIFIAARYLLLNHVAHRGDVVVMLRGTRQIARGEVAALASLAIDPADLGAPPAWMSHHKKVAA